MARVFISYASVDAAVATEVRAWLLADGHTVFLDRSADNGIALGEDWKPRLYSELRKVDAVVCLISPGFLASAWCAAEAGIADALGCLVLPLHIAAGADHPVVGSRQRADYYLAPEQVAARVLDQLREMDGKGRGQWRDGENPYPGLTAFTESMSSIFFGRGSETLALADRVRASTPAGAVLTALTGPSGCGKSSLLAAGLVPHMRADRSWLVLSPFAPGGAPTAALVNRLVAMGRDRGYDWSTTTLRARLADVSDGLSGIASDLLASASEQRRLLVTIDQGEELFDRSTSSRVDAFFRMMRAAADDGAVRVLMALRSEYLDDLTTLAALSGAEIGTYLLRPLDPAMLALAIDTPAQVAGLRIESELTATLVADTSHGDALPLLAFALHRLAEHRRRGDVLTLADYHALGTDTGAPGRGVAGVLTAHADAALQQAGEDSGLDPGNVLRCLTRFASIDETGRRTRRQVDQSTLSPEQRRALAAFVAARLLSSDRDSGGTVWLSPVHEALLTAWKPLNLALEDRSAALVAIRSIEQAAAEWKIAGGPDSYLWESARLASALAALREGGAGAGADDADADADADAVHDLTPDARGFVDATRARIEAQRARDELRQRIEERRRRRTLAAIAASLVLALTAGLVFWQWRIASQARQDAEDARAVAASIGMITQAAAARAADPQSAMELGAAAYQINPSAETAAGLIDTLTNTRYVASVEQSGSVYSVAFTPDARTLITISQSAPGVQASRTLQTWNVADRGNYYSRCFTVG